MNKTRTIEVDGRTSINALVFLEDGKHLLSGGEDGTIRQWRVEDGKEVQEQRLTVAGGSVRAIALSGDGNWIVGTGWLVTTVWNRRTRQIARTMSEHTNWVNAVDVSPDSTRFATGSDDGKTIICQWNMSSGERVLPGLSHDSAVVAVRFSPNGDRLAVAVWLRALHIYNAQAGHLLRTIAVGVYRSNAIVWSNNSQHIFALITGNVLKHINVDANTLLSEWTIPGEAGCNWSTIALPGHGRFIVAFVGLSLTFWDTSTRAQVGPVFDHPAVPRLRSMALSSGNNYVATASDNGVITLRNLNDIIPMSYVVGRDVVQTQTVCRADLHPQIGALRGILRALELHCDGSSDAQEVTPQRIPDGTYRIKNKTGDLYLTGPDAGAGTVVTQPLDSSSVFQKWTISLDGDGAYGIVNHSQLWLTVGIGAPLLAGQKGTTWTFEPRGDAYVIGNVANAMAIQLEQNSGSVSILLRNNSPSQRWVLERLAQ